jgi:polysaccharide biosynthesis/export protein
MKKLSWISALILAVLVAACSSTSKITAPPITDKGVTDEYRIGAGDSLQINVWRNPELSSSVPVRPDGKISMPLVGDIMASNLTTAQLSNNIAAALENYVRSPQITVIVTNPSSSDFQRRVRITGAVRSPQSLPYRDGMTVLDLVLMAGGANEYAAANKAKLYRRTNNETKVYPIHLTDLIENGNLETNYPLQPSDIVTVPERSL